MQLLSWLGYSWIHNAQGKLCLMREYSKPVDCYVHDGQGRIVPARLPMKHLKDISTAERWLFSVLLMTKLDRMYRPVPQHQTNHNA